jgi:hypothetical protein
MNSGIAMKEDKKKQKTPPFLFSTSFAGFLAWNQKDKKRGVMSNVKWATGQAFP